MKNNYINKFQREVEGEFPNIKTYDLTKNSLKEQKGISLNTIQENGKTVKENIKTFFDNTSPEQLIEQMGLQEQSILSIEDRAEKRFGTDIDSIRGSNPYDLNGDLKRGFIAGANEMLLIIKELGEALREIQEANTGGVINTHWMQNHIQITLDKYKQYL